METVLGMIDVDLDGRFSKVRTQETNLGKYNSLVILVSFLVNKIMFLIFLHVKIKVKVCFYIAHVSRPLDRSKRFTFLLLADLFIPIPTRLLCETF